MTTLFTALTDSVVVNVTTTLSLTVGTTYTIQAIGANIFCTEQTSAPDIATVARHRLVPGQESWGSYKVKSGEALYAWAERGASTLGRPTLSVTESP